MKSEDWRQLLRNVDAVRETAHTGTHFVGTSGAHLDTYVEKRMLLANPLEARTVCAAMARPFREDNVHIVAGPALGGIILAHLVAFTLYMESRPLVCVQSIYAEKHDYALVFPDCYRVLIKGKRVLIAEDTLTTGGSVKKMAHAISEAGGIVVGVTCLANNGNVAAEELGVPRLEALTQFSVTAYPAGTECTLCKNGVPIDTTVGHGTAFVQEYGQPTI